MRRLGAHDVFDEVGGNFDLIVEGVGGSTFGQAIEHLTRRGVLVDIATQDDVDTVSFHAARFDRAYGATIYFLNLPHELATHDSAASDLRRLCTLVTEGRLDCQIELEESWQDPGPLLQALLDRRIGGKAVLHVD